MVCVVLHGNAHMQVGGNQVYSLRPSTQVKQQTGRIDYSSALQRGGTGYYLLESENNRILHLGADLELLDVIGPLETGTGELMRPRAVGMRDDSLFVCYAEREFHVFHNSEFKRSFPSPTSGMNRVIAFADNVILFGFMGSSSTSLEDHPILFAGYTGALPPGHAAGFGEWGGDVDLVLSSADVFMDSRGDILAVLHSQPFVQRYSPDYKLIETYDLTLFEAIEASWNWAMMLNTTTPPVMFSRNSLYEDRLYICTSNIGENGEWIPFVVMLDINPEGMTPVGTLELEGPTEGEAVSVRAICAGPNNQLVVYDLATGSLLIYEIPI